MASKTATKIKKSLPADKAHRLSLIFTALSDINRLKIVSTITNYPDICVTDMAKVLKISTPAVSQHFKILELSGLVTRIRKGRMICYKVNADQEPAGSILKMITKGK